MEKVLLAEDGIVVKETPKGFKVLYPVVRDTLTNYPQRGLALLLLKKYSSNYLSEEISK